MKSEIHTRKALVVEQEATMRNCFKALGYYLRFEFKINERAVIAIGLQVLTLTPNFISRT